MFRPILISAPMFKYAAAFDRRVNALVRGIASWNVMLGTVYGRIYKIAIYLEELSQEEAGRIAKDTFNYCREKLGEPSEQKIGRGFPWGTGFFVWNVMDANAILQTVDVDASFAINFAVTSATMANAVSWIE